MSLSRMAAADVNMVAEFRRGKAGDALREFRKYNVRLLSEQCWTSHSEQHDGCDGSKCLPKQMVYGDSLCGDGYVALTMRANLVNR